MQTSLQETKIRLIRIPKAFDWLAMALSARVDCALLLAEAQDVRVTCLTAVTERSPIHPDHEATGAARIAADRMCPI